MFPSLRAISGRYCLSAVYAKLPAFAIRFIMNKNAIDNDHFGTAVDCLGTESFEQKRQVEYNLCTDNLSSFASNLTGIFTNEMNEFLVEWRN